VRWEHPQRHWIVQRLLSGFLHSVHRPHVCLLVEAYAGTIGIEGRPLMLCSALSVKSEGSGVYSSLCTRGALSTLAMSPTQASRLHDNSAVTIPVSVLMSRKVERYSGFRACDSFDTVYIQRSLQTAVRPSHFPHRTRSSVN
jgi:hypothetical protein